MPTCLHGWGSDGMNPSGCPQCADAGVKAVTEENARLRIRVADLESQLNTPELHDFSKAVVLEAAHQRARWGSDHDAGKEPHDWFWLLGYLAGKALRSHQAGEPDKALHHCISSAAVLANWHAAVSGEHTHMRPGIETPAEADPL